MAPRSRAGRCRPLVYSLVTCLLCTLARGTCFGDGCAEEHMAAKAGGLLGDPGPVCYSRQYPLDGSKLVPEKLPEPIYDLRWNGPPHEVDKYVFAMTVPRQHVSSAKLYRSDSTGQPGTWSDITSRLTGIDSARHDIIGIKDITVHPNSTGRMLFHGLGYHHWISPDFGETFEPMDTPGGTLGFWASIKHHPSQPDWLLSLVPRMECLHWSDVMQFYHLSQDVQSPWCARDLFKSEDFGRSWQNLTQASGGAITAFSDYDWGTRIHHEEYQPFPDKTILATVYESAAAMKGLYPGWDKDLHFVRSDDFFASQHKKLASCGNQFEVVGHRVFMAMPNDCPTNPDGTKRTVAAGRSRTIILWTSTDEGNTFEQACLPVKDLDLGYSLVATHDKRGAYIIVDHDEQDLVSAYAPIGNVYTQGFNTSLFTLSMPRNFRPMHSFSAYQVADFARVEGMHGVLMANQLAPEVLDQPASAWGPPDYESYIQTKISFSGGAQWHDLTVPGEFRHPACNRCKPGDGRCRLHLLGPSSWYLGQGARPSFYSQESARGIIMAVGNTGDHLDLAADELCTWLSRDGGVSWQDIYNGTGIYEFGDHGGLLVLAPHREQHPASEVLFSLDEGHCWDRMPLAEAIDVENIRVEPRGASHVVVVHGMACRKSDANPTCSLEGYGSSEGRMYVLDIKTLMGADFRVCNHDTDYEKWTPLSPTKGCLLGTRLSMERRKQDSRCFNGMERELERNASFKLCPCEPEDVECEFGYERTAEGCVQIPGVSADKCGEISNKGYLMSRTHQRLVHADLCMNINRVIPDTNGHGGLPERGGGSKGTSRSHAGIIAATLSLAFVAAIAGACIWLVRFSSDATRERAEEMAAPVLGFFSSSVGWARDRFSGLGLRRQAQEAYFEPLPDSDLGLEEIDGRSPPVRTGF